MTYLTKVFGKNLPGKNLPGKNPPRKISPGKISPRKISPEEKKLLAGRKNFPKGRKKSPHHKKPGMKSVS